MECANHAVKCYRTALENLVHDKPSYKGKGKLTEAMRKKLTKAARGAIIMRSQETDKVQAVKKLQHDLLNSPLHCLGIHSKCIPDFCRTQQQVQQPQQQQTPPQQQQHQIQEQQIHEQQHQIQEQQIHEQQQIQHQIQVQQQIEQQQQQQSNEVSIGETTLVSITEEDNIDTTTSIYYR